MFGIVGSCLLSVGRGIDVSSLVNIDVNWDWRTSALSSAVSALHPPAVVRDGMPTLSFFRDLM